MAETPALEAPDVAGAEIDGPKVRELRKLAGETVTSLAKVCGISDSYLSVIERGERRTVSAPVFARICDALGIEDRRELLRKAAA